MKIDLRQLQDPLLALSLATSITQRITELLEISSIYKTERLYKQEVQGFIT